MMADFLPGLWRREKFEIARAEGPQDVRGYTYRALGIHMHSKASPKGRRPANWTLTHLGTGHRLAYLSGDLSIVSPVATEIAEAGDWDFLSMQGWKDKFPNARQRLEEICAAHPTVATILTNRTGALDHVAQQIAANRP